jgi:hypothetical protein
VDLFYIEPEIMDSNSAIVRTEFGLTTLVVSSCTCDRLLITHQKTQRNPASCEMPGSSMIAEILERWLMTNQT